MAWKSKNVKKEKEKKKIASSSYHSMEEESNHYFSQHRWEVVLKAVNAGSGFALPLGASADCEVSDVNIPWALWRLQSIRLRDTEGFRRSSPLLREGNQWDYALSTTFSRFHIAAPASHGIQQMCLGFVHYVYVIAKNTNHNDTATW